MHNSQSIWNASPRYIYTSCHTAAEPLDIPIYFLFRSKADYHVSQMIFVQDV